MAEPVLLISSDPFLGASVEAVARGRLRVARLDPSRRPVVWPGGQAAGTVVLDVTARQRAVLHAWVRRHHPGPLVVLLKPGERVPSLPPDPAQVVMGRPFRLSDLVTVLEDPPAPAPDAPDPAPPDRRREPTPSGRRQEPAPPFPGPPNAGRPEPAPPDSGAPAREGSPAGEGVPAPVHSPPTQSPTSRQQSSRPQSPGPQPPRPSLADRPDPS